jgi:regulatory associated protein of mTOR
VTSLTSDLIAGEIVIAGFGDGALRVYDKREPTTTRVVRTYKDYHQSAVVNVRMQRGGMRELISGWQVETPHDCFSILIFFKTVSMDR